MGWAKRLALLLCLAAAGVQAQDAPKAEIFTGYSFSRLEGGSGLSGINLNGWNAAITGNVNSWFGVTADFSGHYGSTTFDAGITRHSFLFGPKVTYRGGNGKVSPFAHALFGAVRAHRGIANPGPLGTPLPLLPAASETAFGMALGGGVDYNVNDRVAIRLIQAEYLMTRFDEASGIVCIQSISTPCPTTKAGTQNNLRLSFGVVWRFGSK